jgi:hypothetical protein
VLDAFHGDNHSYNSIISLLGCTGQELDEGISAKALSEEISQFEAAVVLLCFPLTICCSTSGSVCCNQGEQALNTESSRINVDLSTGTLSRTAVTDRSFTQEIIVH